MTHIIFPEANRRDYEEVSEDLRAGMIPHFVTTYEQVFDLALTYDESEVSSSPPAAAELEGLGQGVGQEPVMAAAAQSSWRWL